MSRTPRLLRVLEYAAASWLAAMGQPASNLRVPPLQLEELTMFSVMLAAAVDVAVACWLTASPLASWPAARRVESLQASLVD